MTKKPISTAVIAIVAGLVLASAETLLANGEAFFIQVGRGPVELAYFARVKDARTGKPIRVAPYVSIVDPFSGVYVPFQVDRPGHLRSPDIDAAIKEVSSPPIDTKQLEIVISAAGYQTLKVKNVPRQSKGIVELNIRMEPKANAGSTEASPSAALASASRPASGNSA